MTERPFFVVDLRIQRLNASLKWMHETLEYLQAQIDDIEKEVARIRSEGSYFNDDPSAAALPRVTVSDWKWSDRGF